MALVMDSEGMIHERQWMISGALYDLDCDGYLQPVNYGPVLEPPRHSGLERRCIDDVYVLKFSAG